MNITDVKQLLGQGLTQDSASAVNPDSEHCLLPKWTGIVVREKNQVIRDTGQCEICQQTRHVARHHLITGEERDRMRAKLGPGEALPPSAYDSLTLCGGCHYDLHCEFTNYELNRMTKADQIAAVLKFLRAQGSAACAASRLVDDGSNPKSASAPVDEAVPKENNDWPDKHDVPFSTHLKRTGDFIEPADY